MLTGSALCSCRQLAADIVHHLDDIGAGLLGDLHQNGGLAVDRAQVADILDPVIDLGDVLEPDRRAVAIGDDQGLVVAGQRWHCRWR